MFNHHSTRTVARLASIAASSGSASSASIDYSAPHTQVPSEPLSSRLKPCFRRHSDRLLSPPRAVKTTAYATPCQSGPCSGLHIARLASYCFQDTPSLFLMFPYRSFPLELLLSLFRLLFLFSHRTQGDTPPSSTCPAPNILVVNPSRLASARQAIITLPFPFLCVCVLLP